MGLRLGDLLTDAGLTVERYACRASVIRVPPGTRPPSWAARNDMVAEGFATDADIRRWEDAFARLDAAQQRPWLFPSGVALSTLAAAFPASRFEGFDPSQHAIDRARARLAGNGLLNLDFRVAGAEDLPQDNRYDFIVTLDCIHDLPRPAEAIAAIRRAIRPDGTWLIKDIRSGPTWPDNIGNPMLAMMYGMSVSYCLSSALSEPGGTGLGTLGFHPELAERMCRDAGFSRFTVHDFDDPADLYYEVRP